VRTGKSSEMLLNWIDILDRYKRQFLFLPVIFCVLLASGLVFLTENNDGRIFFDEASPERQQLLTLEQRFTETNSLLLVLSSKTGDIFTPDALQVILEVTELAWQLPYVTRVNSLSNFQHIQSDEDDLIIADLFTGDVLSNSDAISQMRDYALAEQDLVDQILSRDGATTAIALNIAAPRGDSNALKTIMAEVEKLRGLIKENHSGLSLYITGDVALDNAFSEAFAYDLRSLFPVFLAIIFLVCSIFFRSLWLSTVLLSMMIMVISATMGLSGYLNINLTAGTTGVPIILITIALADFIHLLSTMRLAMRAGLNQIQAIQRAIKNNFLPISLTSFTTLIGFLSLNFNDAPPFRDMGNLVAIGILISYLMTFTFFPAVLARMDLGRIFTRKLNSLSASPDFIATFSKALVQKRKGIALAIIAVTIGIGSGLTKIEFDDDWVKYFDPENTFRQDTEFVVRHLTGVDTIEYMVSSGKEDGIAEAAFLNRLDQFGIWALEQPEIIHISSIVSLFKKLNFHMNGGQEKFRTIAPDPGLNAQYLLLYEMSLPVGLDLNDRIDIAKAATRVTITAQDLTSRQMRDLDVRVSQKLQEMKLIGPYEGGSGVPLMFANLSERNIKSMLMGIAFALILVSLVIALSFKSLKLGIISFIVNILPIILGFGLWGWFYQYIGISLTVVAAIAFGIVVDDSIHFITKYNTAMKKHSGNIEAAFNMTFASAGGALVMTTCILVMGFMVLSFSAFQPTWGLGLISAIMILFALMYDFLLLPVLLMVTRNRLS